MMRRKIGPDGIQEKNPSKVYAPIQNIDYFNMYYQIDKSNQISRCTICFGETRKQELRLGTQAVVLFLQYSMTLNNAYKVYTVLYERKHQQDEKQN